MSRSPACFFVVCIIALFVTPATLVSKEGKTATPIQFTLLDVRSGKPVSLTGFKDKKAIVVVFLGTACPVNNAYMPRLAELSKQYASQGVQFLGINSNRIDDAKEIA